MKAPPRITAHQSGEFLDLVAFLNFWKPGLQGITHKLLVVGAGDYPGAIGFLGVDYILGKDDGKADLGLEKSAISLGEDAGQQDHKEPQRDGDGNDAVSAKPRFSGMAAAQRGHNQLRCGWVRGGHEITR